VEAIQWHSFFFLLFALLACAFAIAVVVAGNIVRMAVYLVASLAAVSGLFFLAGAEFLGAMQLMVYVGGTLVLLVFGVMLTARGPFASMSTGGGQWIMALLVGGSLLAVLLQTVVNVVPLHGRKAAGAEQIQAASAQTTSQLGMGLLGVRTDPMALTPPTATPANASRPQVAPGYLLVFEIISVHLLVVLVGAAYLARARRPRRRDADQARGPGGSPDR
jgi:NADH-quinone oxidoreductase subunit J